MYLPQYHIVPENSMWWGEGFTDWVTVRNAKPLFPGHEQPKSPLDDRYYDLLEKDTWIWQSELMRKYGIDGLSIYHYWFRDGKQILEKPVEKLLNWKDINIPFCFCWANETWARSWSGVRNKNTWADTFENQKKDFNPSILLEQRYGFEEEWKKHFDYLRRFFDDSRYIKIDGKPLIMIYRADIIPCLSNMLDMWKKWAVQEGFKGLFIIGAQRSDKELSMLDAELIHEPVRAKIWFEEREKEHKYPFKHDYDKIWENILGFRANKSAWYGGFVSYDDTPRRGINGSFIAGYSTEKFREYLKELMAKNEMAGNEYTLINAWNEWGEGMYLEPDKELGYQMLEAVKEAKDNYHQVLFRTDKYEEPGRISEEEKDIRKLNHYLFLLDKWLSKDNWSEKFISFASKNNIKKIGIYGYSVLGKQLFRELSTKEKIDIECIIDKRDLSKANVPVAAIKSSEEIPKLDAIVVTAVEYYNEIYLSLKNRTDAKIYSLEHLIDELGEDLYA